MPRQDIPEKIREMHRVYNHGGFPQAKNYNFYRQGVFMADYEDDYEYTGRFVRYFPTYHDMTDEQLRGYFSWRTKYRKMRAQGVLDAAFVRDSIDRCMSFLYVYIYELLNNIGVKSPEEGWAILWDLDLQFGSLERGLHSNLVKWMRDYAVYYGLDPAVAADVFPHGRNQSLSVLEDFQSVCCAGTPSSEMAFTGAPGTSPEKAGVNADSERAELEAVLHNAEKVHRIFLAICELSSVDLSRSAFYKRYPEDMEAVTVRAYAGITDFCRACGKYLLTERFFGRRGSYPHVMFESAIFYDSRKYEDYTYQAGADCVYRCRKGFWTRESYLRDNGTSRELGTICHEIDRQMRDQWQFGRRLQKRKLYSQMEDAIAAAIRDVLHEKEEAARPKVEIDLTRLDAIRREAAKTRDKLIVEDEESGLKEDVPQESGSKENRLKANVLEPQAGAANESEEPSVRAGQKEPAMGADRSDRDEAGLPAIQSREKAETVESVTENEAVESGQEGEEDENTSEVELTPQQREFMRRILAGQDATAYARENHLMMAVLVDSVNEAFYDEIGDSVLEMDGDTPVLIEDYREDVENFVG